MTREPWRRKDGIRKHRPALNCWVRRKTNNPNPEERGRVSSRGTSAITIEEKIRGVRAPDQGSQKRDGNYMGRVYSGILRF